MPEPSFFSKLHDFVSQGLHFLNAGKILLCPTYLMGFCGNQERKNYFKIQTCNGIKLEEWMWELFHFKTPLKKTEKGLVIKSKPLPERWEPETTATESGAGRQTRAVRRHWVLGKSCQMTVSGSGRDSKEGLERHLVLNWDEQSYFSPNPKLRKGQC